MDARISTGPLNHAIDLTMNAFITFHQNPVLWDMMRGLGFSPARSFGLPSISVILSFSGTTSSNDSFSEMVNLLSDASGPASHISSRFELPQKRGWHALGFSQPSLRPIPLGPDQSQSSLSSPDGNRRSGRIFKTGKCNHESVPCEHGVRRFAAEPISSQEKPAVNWRVLSDGRPTGGKWALLGSNQ